MPQKSARRWLFYLYLLLLLLPCTELALRIVGYRPYQRSEYSIRSEPAFCILPDAHLGFALAPGNFEVTINEGHRYNVTHNADSQRISSFYPDTISKSEILILGCSYSYGMGVDDSATYAFRLQEKLPNYRIKNLAVPGYGTVQSYLQLKRHIEKGDVPAFVILGYAGFHNERNVLTPSYRKHLHIGFEESDTTLRQHLAMGSFPFVEKNDNRLVFREIRWQDVYQDWPGRKTFALVNALQTFSEDKAAYKLQPEAATLQLIRMMDSLCQEQQIKFMVAGLTQDALTKSMLQLLEKEGIFAVDVSVDLSDETYTNAPFDTHPNARAHTRYAEGLPTKIETMAGTLQRPCLQSSICKSLKTLIVIAYCGNLSLILIYCLAQLYLAILYLVKKKRPVKTALPETLPIITVQLPIFNEKYVIERLIRAVCAFDYPKEKLEIQVLDDSTDETVDIVQRLATQLQKQDFDIQHIRRPKAVDFKAGALAEGMKTAKGSFIAIFDADFVPQPDFLKKTLPYFDDKAVGMVQSRWGHLNQNYSLLTRIQAYALNAHFTIEQAGRNAFGHFMNFNGTAGVWRREAITEAGGWQGDTLTEDLDLSYRSQLKGWDFVFLEDLESPAELPAEMNALKSQQFRWAKGAAECARKNLGKVLRAPSVPFSTKITAAFHLFNSLMWVSIFISGMLLPPFLYVMSNTPEFQEWGSIFSVFHLTFVLLLFFYLVANWKLNLKKWYDLPRFILHYPAFLSLSMGISLYNAVGVVEGYLGKRSSFVRTPKFHITDGAGSIRGKQYVEFRPSAINLFELLSFLYFCFGLWYSLQVGQYVASGFLLLMAAGYGITLGMSWWAARGGLKGWS
ncbi:MAG: glycosyltransferase [Bacteroidia bacterium]